MSADWSANWRNGAIGNSKSSATVSDNETGPFYGSLINDVGGLVGVEYLGAPITGSSASGSVNGIGLNGDNVGGLVGANITNGFVPLIDLF